ncbi:MAG: methyl-accepting chemotaxis protein, partial [Candidatus Accumulibacter sp.]|nr:methyl-accepting chemotaxis protein [Accumulibacter sp.]
IVQLEKVNGTSTEIEVNWLPSTRVAGDLNTATSDFRVAELQHVLSTDEAEMGRYEKELGELAAQLDKLGATYAKLVSTPEEQAVFDSFKGSWSEYLTQHKQVLALSRANRNDEAKVLVRGQAQKEFTDASADLSRLSDLNQAGGAASSRRGDALYAESRIAIIVVALGALALGVALALFIARSLVRQLGGEPAQAAAIAARIADGDLRVAVPLRQGDTSSMMHAIGQMRDSLAALVGEVRSGTATIAIASTELASGNLDLSSRTEEQASALEETASSMEELTSTVKQSADNARQANALALSASEVAGKGGAVVAEVVDTMNAINASSNQISEIIGVIDGIAFQTNILALNAAVEAARAGEQGRGFAVVASEVRTLAQRSAAAAKEIKCLIGNSVEKVEAGGKLVAQAGTTMGEIVESVRRVTDMMAEIMAAAQEQTAGIEQINEAISTMDQVTQQNAALVEEAAAASQSMREQAAGLERAVSVFQTGDAAVKTSAPVARQPLPAPARTPRAPAVARNTAAPALAGGEWEAF